MSIDNTQKDTHMNTQNAQKNVQNTIDAIIDRTLAMIEEGVDRNVGDMTLMKSLEFIGILMDIRERQQAYVKHTQKKVRACGKACIKKPKHQ